MPMLKVGTWKSEDGFTLIELSMVLIIIGIISVFAVPRFKGLLWHGDVKAAARRLSATIRYTYNQTAMTRVRHRLNYDLDSRRYWITIREADGEFVEEDSTLAKNTLLPDKVKFKDVVTPRKGEVIHGTAYTGFTPNGLVESTVIHLENESEKVYTLIIQPLTGRVKVYDRYVKVIR